MRSITPSGFALSFMEPSTPITAPKEASIKDADTKGMQPLPKLARLTLAGLV